MEKNFISYETDLCFNLVVDDYSFGIRVLTTRSGDFKCQVYDFEQRVDVNQRPNRSENSL